MQKIKTIDLWTEQYENHYECFNGAFVDGFENGKIAFDEYKIIQNCNCKITVHCEDVFIQNKHQAIVFYKEKVPVRLLVINKNTDVFKCIEVALEQYFGSSVLKNYFNDLKITSWIIDQNEIAILKDNDDFHCETDVGSCDRWNLLYNMLKGSYTESETSYGNFESDKYEFLPNLDIQYELVTDSEFFLIEHHCAFINTIKTRLIPIQENSPLTKRNRIEDL